MLGRRAPQITGFTLKGCSVMQDIICGGCILLSLVGGGYAIWMVCDCYRQIRENKGGGNCARWDWRVEWLTQVLAAAAFLVVAGAILVNLGPKQIKSMSLGEHTEPVVACSVQVDGMCPLPPRRLHFGSDRPGAPIVGVDLSSLPVTDDDVRALLRSAPEIEWLNLNGTDVTDAIVGEIAQMPCLVELCLANTAISDVGLARLAEVERLESLVLAGVPITDEGVCHLKTLTNLRKLNLQQTGITDACSETLCCLKRLRDLRICETEMTLDGYRRVCQALPDLPKTEFWYEKLRRASRGESSSSSN